MPVKSIPAPVSGWNTKDALADMPEDTASVLDNWFPQEGRVEVRPGYTSYATTLGGNVESLMEYVSGSTRKLLAAANGNIWDISSAGAGSSLGSGFTNNRWQHINMDGKMGFVNGTDTPQQYSGSTISTLTITGTGLTSSNLIGCNVFQNRSYWWEDNSQDFWYSAVNTLGGALTKFPLSRVGQFGGKLIAMSTWTHDAGDGMNDTAVFFMSSGEVIVYQGTDPEDSFWSLVGVFRVGAPFSIRGAKKIAGDLIAITKDGYISLNQMINKGRIGDAGKVSKQINPSVIAATEAYSSNFGWEIFHYPKANMMIFNVPVSTSTINQHVFNTNTGAPCRFKGLNAFCWGLYSDEAYFGGGSTVYKLTGFTDNGAAIDCDCVTASTYLGKKEIQKLVTAVQPHTVSDGKVSLNIKVEADFKTPIAQYKTADFVGGDSDWDTADWDTASWASGNNPQNDWQSASAFGYSLSANVKARIIGQLVKWYSLNYLFKPGGAT